MSKKMDMTAQAFLRKSRDHFMREGRQEGVLFVFQTNSDVPMIIPQTTELTLEQLISLGQKVCAGSSVAYVVFVREDIGDIGMPNARAKRAMLRRGITELSGVGRFLVVSVETRKEVVFLLNKIHDDGTLSDDVMIMDQSNDITDPGECLLYGRKP